VLPTPPPILTEKELQHIPPPPLPQQFGVGQLKKPPLPLLKTAPIGAKPIPPLKAPAKQNPEVAKFPAKVPAKPMQVKVVAKKPPLSSSQELKRQSSFPTTTLSSSQELKRESSFPQGRVYSHPSLNTTPSSAPEEESRAFVEYINTSTAMQQDKDVKGILPISPTSTQIYTIVSEGWLLWYTSPPDPPFR
jgi:hypothetical protein